MIQEFFFKIGEVLELSPGQSHDRRKIGQLPMFAFLCMAIIAALS
jgi:hypothetical protein